VWRRADKNQGEDTVEVEMEIMRTVLEEVQEHPGLFGRRALLHLELLVVVVVLVRTH
jgi:hypothetical protein